MNIKTYKCQFWGLKVSTKKDILQVTKVTENVEMGMN